MLLLFDVSLLNYFYHRNSSNYAHVKYSDCTWCTLSANKILKNTQLRAKNWFKSVFISIIRISISIVEVNSFSISGNRYSTVLIRRSLGLLLLLITGSPAGLSRVNGVRRSSAKTWNFNPSPKAQFVSLDLTFSLEDSVREVTSPAKFGSDPMSGRDKTRGQHIRELWISFILQQSYSPYPWTNFRAQKLKRRGLVWGRPYWGWEMCNSKIWGIFFIWLSSIACWLECIYRSVRDAITRQFT